MTILYRYIVLFLGLWSVITPNFTYAGALGDAVEAEAIYYSGFKRKRLGSVEAPIVKDRDDISLEPKGSASDKRQISSLEDGLKSSNNLKRFRLDLDTDLVDVADEKADKVESLVRDASATSVKPILLARCLTPDTDLSELLKRMTALNFRPIEVDAE